MSLNDTVQRIKQAWDTFARAALKPSTCAFCGGTRVWWDGTRNRSATVLTEDGVAHIVNVRCRRVKCAERACQKSWTVRPPGLAPHRHYQLCVVASALSRYLFGPHTTQAAVAQDHQCSERTVGRWLRWVSGVADPAIIQRKLLEAVQAPILVPVRGIESLARKARSTARQEILPRAAQVLAEMEILGAALGLAPPGLRGVIERVLGHRTRMATYRTPLIPELAR